MKNGRHEVISAIVYRPEGEPRMVHPMDGCPKRIMVMVDEEEWQPLRSDLQKRWIPPSGITDANGDPLEALIKAEEEVQEGQMLHKLCAWARCACRNGQFSSLEEAVEAAKERFALAS
ncbi:MAG: hypothetical protein COU09_01985 [Candidatus Harrisonbacteria bacterium CG10_big_fil_rev_8_21_14_0_10_44_23]|uniref:Uncharacterized protein n=1 Tax=Candidatus Harrisonbacteria bacterium CG10_big_fil_rev_8_21_14_0_10_44_23 TaxID=1974585 RepID=A0A2H0UQ07_9BACT|nr:MAG: hypothetical protein COU09_01985 [Candidatus Harrisonbacteria bacterium CG10_big_fil_rev_8_21_14_0_10_44_23]